MNWGVFFWLLSVHLFCDFVIQFKNIVNLRYSQVFIKRVKGNSMHACIHFAISSLMIALFYSCSIIAFLFLFLSALAHGLIDYFKAYIVIQKPKLKNNLTLFLGDQFLHIFILYIFSHIISSYTQNLTLYNVFAKVKIDICRSLATITYSQKIALTVAIMIAALWGVGIFIRIFLDALKERTVTKKDIEVKIKSMIYNQSTPDGGFIIGIMERFFIICAIVLDMTQIIGFLLATKSIARFKKFDDDCFVENFIIGSFISFSCAIVAGVIIRVLKIIPIE